MQNVNNWSAYKQFQARSFPDLKELLERECTEPVDVVKWGFMTSGFAYVVVKPKEQQTRRRAPREQVSIELQHLPVENAVSEELTHDNVQP